jgi:hypothetical protein
LIAIWVLLADIEAQQRATRKGHCLEYISWRWDTDNGLSSEDRGFDESAAVDRRGATATEIDASSIATQTKGLLRSELLSEASDYGNDNFTSSRQSGHLLVICKGICERLVATMRQDLRSDKTIGETGDMMGIPSPSFIRRIRLSCITYTVEVGHRATPGYGRL